MTFTFPVCQVGFCLIPGTNRGANLDWRWCHMDIGYPTVQFFDNSNANKTFICAKSVSIYVMNCFPTLSADDVDQAL